MTSRGYKLLQMAKTQKDGLKHIVRVANVDIPGGKSLRFALTKVKGVGVNLADTFCKLAGVDRTMKAGALTEEQVTALTQVIQDPVAQGVPKWLFNRRKDNATGEDKHVIEGSLNFEKEADLKRLQKIKCYKGVRHRLRLTVRGQRTRSNFRRSKGKVVGVKKKK